MYKVGVFHPGTQHSWQTAYAFQESDELQWYLTSIYFSRRSVESNLMRILPNSIRSKVSREMSRRSFHSLDDTKVHVSGLIEWAEVLCNRLGYRNLSEQFDWLGNKTFHKNVKSLCSKKPVDLLWGYNNVSLETFQWAKKNGIKTVLDQTIGHPRSYNKIIVEEKQKFPEYFFNDTDYLIADRVAIRNQLEVEIADFVVVGSEFCAETMVKFGCNENKIRVVPYGYDEKIFSKTSISSSSNQMRFLFVGSVIPRKGVHYLIEAFKQIPPDKARLDIVGGIGIPNSAISKLPSNIILHGSVPRTEVARFFDDSDVFIFPSLFEGGGIVLYEACAAGLAIIQTLACGDGVRADNGILIQNVSTESLLAEIMYLIDNPNNVQEMKNKSFIIRNERSWEKYRKDVRCILHDILK